MGSGVEWYKGCEGGAADGPDTMGEGVHTSKERTRPLTCQDPGECGRSLGQNKTGQRTN